MSESEGILKDLVDHLARLPGIGVKSAERLAYHILKVSDDEAVALAEAIRRVKEDLRRCTRCLNISEDQLCNICNDDSRDKSVVCVVEQPKDLIAIESSGIFKGLYHVLGGNFSPLEERGPDSLALDRLLDRVETEGVVEVILATNPDFEGDGTALLVKERLEGKNAVVSRLARGIPTGGQIEYMNQSILRDALEGRRSLAGAATEETEKQ